MDENKGSGIGDLSGSEWLTAFALMCSFVSFPVGLYYGATNKTLFGAVFISLLPFLLLGIILIISRKVACKIQQIENKGDNKTKQ